MHSAIHVVFDTHSRERLQALGATCIVCASDCLALGPNRLDPIEHAKQREAWWNSPEKWDHLDSPDIQWRSPVVVWVSSSNVLERINLWRTLSWIKTQPIAAAEVRILELEPTPSKAPPSPFDCSATVGRHSDATLLDRLGAATPWPQARYDAGVHLWQLYVDPDPSRFAAACAAGIDGFPELPALWRLLSSFFPRKTADGRLHLSSFDQMLFAALSSDWQTPVSLFVSNRAPGSLWGALLDCTGDLFVPERLNQWASHGSNPAVLRAAGPRSPDTHGPMVTSVYRLGERGVHLRSAGLEHIDDAPPLPVGGTEVYRSEAPWVLLDDGKLC